jgi:hypothetical protein
MTNPHESLPRAARKMLAKLQSHYAEHKTPLPIAEISFSCRVSISHGQEMIKMLREAGLIIYVGTAEQACRNDLKTHVKMFAPAGAPMLPRMVRPLDEKAKDIPENHALGPRWCGEFKPAKPKQRYKGEKMPPRYVPPFEELDRKRYDLWAARDLAMLAR